MPRFLQSYKKLCTVTPVVCHSPLGSGGVSLAPRQGLECAVLTQHHDLGWWDTGEGCHIWLGGDVGDFTVVWGQGFTELAWKELRAGLTPPWGREQGSS